jgi:hypothetical protein
MNKFGRSPLDELSTHRERAMMTALGGGQVKFTSPR